MLSRRMSAQCFGAKAQALRYGVLRRLHRATLDDLASWLRLEDRRLLGEGVDALALFCRWLLHDHHANEAGNNEDAILLQLGMTDAGHGLDDALHVLACEVGGVLFHEGLDQVGFRKRTFGHWVSLGWGSRCMLHAASRRRKKHW